MISKSFYRTTILSVLFLFSIDMIAAFPPALSKKFRQYGFTSKGVSIFVQDVHKKNPVLSVNADTPRKPASIIKLVTTAAALEELGPDYTWKTQIYTSGALINGTLRGDLYIKGHGDPFLTPEYFWRLLREISDMGIKNISGNVIMDDSYFKKDQSETRSFDGRPHRSYNAKSSALLINFQSIRFNFYTDQGRVKVTAFPHPDTIKIDNQIRSLPGTRCGGWKRRIKMDVIPKTKNTVVRFSGGYPDGCERQYMYRVVNDSSEYLEGFFRVIWKQLGGTFSGKIRNGKVPPQAVLFHENESLPLMDLVRGINKFSNNVMTRQLLLTLGAEMSGPPATYQKGLAAIEQWRQKIGLLGPLTMENGAGLSRETRTSAKLLGKLLVSSYHKPYMSELMSSLPINGVDGTMSRRLNGSRMHGRMHLKTGSINFVRSVAGYVLSKSGKRYAVVMIHNHPRAHSFKAQKIQDALLSWVYNQ